MATDITKRRTGEDKLYLCAIKAVFSNRIIGKSKDSRMIVTAVHTGRSAGWWARRSDVADRIVHSDRGSQFRSRKFVRALRRKDMVGSMGRVGAAGNNAAMKSLLSLLQKNVLNRRLGTAASSYASPSSPGSNAPTTSDAAKSVWPVEPHRLRSNHDHTGQSGRVTELSPVRAADPMLSIGYPTCRLKG